MMWSISSSIRIIRCSSATPLPDRWSIVYHPLRSRPFSSDTHPSAPAAGRRGGAGSITCGDWARVRTAGAIANVVPALMNSRRFISPPNDCLLAFPHPVHRFFKRLALNAAAQNQSWRELLVAGERQREFSDVRWSQGLEYSTSGRPPVSLLCSDALSPAI